MKKKNPRKGCQANATVAPEHSKDTEASSGRERRSLALMGTGFLLLAARLESKQGVVTFSGFGTFAAAAMINIPPTETSLGSGVNTCQSGSERRHLPSYSAATAAPSGDTLSKVQIYKDSKGV